MSGKNRLFPTDEAAFRQAAASMATGLLARKTGVLPAVSSGAREKIALPAISAGGISVEQGMEVLLDKVFTQMLPTDNKRYYSFIPSTASPLSWLGGMITDAFNPHAATWSHSLGPSSVEDAVIRYCADKIGFPASAGGLLVSGGSVSNLAALTLARDTKLTEQTRATGVAYVSDQTHASVAKGLRMLGLFDRQIRKIKSDHLFRMDTGELEKAIREDVQQGLHPFVVIASAGTTNTGSIDPLEAIAHLCSKYHLWMHVDGAFGASVALSQSYTHLLSGIQLADSVSWDAHKWLFQTYGCGLLLVRDQRWLFESFNTSPEYLQDVGYYPEMPNYMDLGPELTRPARAVKLWFTLSVAGSEAIGQAIDHGIQLAVYAEQLLRQQAQVVISSPAQLGILNFRYTFEGLNEAEEDAINRGLCMQLQASGTAYVVTTRLDGRIVIRLCCINPMAEQTDIAATINTLSNMAIQTVIKTVSEPDIANPHVSNMAVQTLIKTVREKPVQ